MFEIVKKILNKSEIDKLSQKLIISTNTGYELYGEYSITKTNTGFKVQKYHTHLDKDFYSLKNAVIWTTMDKKNDIVDSDSITYLDTILEGLDTNIEVYKNLCNKSSNYEAKIIYYAKLNEAKSKRAVIIDRIETYSEKAKFWQYKKYEEALK